MPQATLHETATSALTPEQVEQILQAVLKPLCAQLEPLKHLQSLPQFLPQFLPGKAPQPDWQATAFRWRHPVGETHGYLQSVRRVAALSLNDLQHIAVQKDKLVANTKQFLAGLPANNVLMTGARGCGKSSLLRALVHEFADQGLRVLEIDKNDLADLPEVVDCLAERSERFIIFCDDLSFEAGDERYKALKSLLDGSLAAPPANVLVYATSNRRNLMPDFFADNLENDEIRPGETVEEKASLAERFGLWLSFYAFDQEEYLAIARHWLKHYRVPLAVIAQSRAAALQWSQLRGARSGRIAWQFARDYAGRYFAAGSGA